MTSVTETVNINNHTCLSVVVSRCVFVMTKKQYDDFRNLQIMVTEIGDSESQSVNIQLISKCLSPKSSSTTALQTNLWITLSDTVNSISIINLQSTFYACLSWQNNTSVDLWTNLQIIINDDVIDILNTNNQLVNIQSFYMHVCHSQTAPPWIYKLCHWTNLLIVVNTVATDTGNTNNQSINIQSFYMHNQMAPPSISKLLDQPVDHQQCCHRYCQYQQQECQYWVIL